MKGLWKHGKQRHRIIKPGRQISLLVLLLRLPSLQCEETYSLNEIRVSNLSVGVGAKSVEKAQQQHISSSRLKVVVNKRKRRKVEGCDSGQGKAAAEGTENLNSGPQSESDTLSEAKVTISQPPETAAPETAAPETAAPSPGLANLLQGYSSGGSEADD